MMIKSRWLLVLSMSALCAVSTPAQNVSEGYCKRIRNSVIDKLNPTKIDRDEVYDDECVFDVTVAGDIDVMLSVEKHDTEEDGYESLDRFLSLLTTGTGLESEADLHYGDLETGNFWDEVFFIRATSTDSGVLMLRKGKIAIKALSLREEYLTQAEQLLRSNME